MGMNALVEKSTVKSEEPYSRSSCWYLLIRLRSAITSHILRGPRHRSRAPTFDFFRVDLLTPKRFFDRKDGRFRRACTIASPMPAILPNATRPLRRISADASFGSRYNFICHLPWITSHLRQIALKMI